MTKTNNIHILIRKFIWALRTCGPIIESTCFLNKCLAWTFLSAFTINLLHIKSYYKLFQRNHATLSCILRPFILYNKKRTICLQVHSCESKKIHGIIWIAYVSMYPLNMKSWGHKKHWCTHQSYGPKKFPREHHCFHKQNVSFAY